VSADILIPLDAYPQSMKRRARQRVKRAKLDGVLVPAESCERCGKTEKENGRKLDLHHTYGYWLWYLGEWLCRWCHSRTHSGWDKFTPEERRAFLAPAHAASAVQRTCSCGRTASPGGLGTHLRANPDHARVS
jgi:hypothetical protein